MFRMMCVCMDAGWLADTSAEPAVAAPGRSSAVRARARVTPRRPRRRARGGAAGGRPPRGALRAVTERCARKVHGWMSPDLCPTMRCQARSGAAAKNAGRKLPWARGARRRSAPSAPICLEPTSPPESESLDDPEPARKGAASAAGRPPGPTSAALNKTRQLPWAAPPSGRRRRARRWTRQPPRHTRAQARALPAASSTRPLRRHPHACAARPRLRAGCTPGGRAGGQV